MTDEELVKRLRNAKVTQDFRHTLEDEAADRIEQLDKACSQWAEVSQSNYQRAKALEAKLNKVVSALRSIAEQTKDVTPEIVNLNIAIHSVHRFANDILKENE